MRKQEEFEGQTLHVLPGPMHREMAHHVLLYQLTTTGIGWYPPVQYHYCEQLGGASQHMLILCVDGVGWCDVGGQHVAAGTNQALIIPRETPHGCGVDDADPWSICWVHLIGPAACSSTTVPSRRCYAAVRCTTSAGR